MSNKTDIERINNMTFKQLKEELSKNKNNKVREMIIRKSMYIRYHQHMKKKISDNTQKVPSNKPLIPFIPNFDLSDFNSNDSSIDEPDNLNQDDRESDTQPFGRDYTNNGLMERLNSDLDIRTMKMPPNKKDFIPPYSNTTDGNYASFDNIFSSERKNFSNP